MPRIGHIQPGSVEILDKTLGAYKGSHFTGNIQFKVHVACRAAQPVKGARIACRVLGKNDAGLIGQNFRVPFVMFVPKDKDNFEQIASINHNDVIEVEVLDWKLQAPTKDQPNAQYWIICRITNERSSAVSLTAIGKHDFYPLDFIMARGQPDVGQRTELTARWYDVFQSIKNEIDNTIKAGYVEHLRGLAGNYDKDFLISAITAGRVDTAWVINKPDATDGGIKFTVITGNAPEPSPEDLSSSIENMDVVLFLKGSDKKYEVINFWSDHIKYAINEYELLRPNGAYKRQMKQARYAYTEPVNVKDAISRAYYKMYEMLGSKFDGRDVLPAAAAAAPVVLCIAEAPGGFVQAIVDRKMLVPGSELLAISISEKGKSNVWSDLEERLKRRTGLTIHDGKYHAPSGSTATITLIGNKPGSGDITNPENVDEVASVFPKADLITADGGIPHKVEEDHEIYSAKLILAEILMAIKCQKEGGSFVLKLFDITTQVTVNFIAILNYFYNSVHFYKPVTSRPASSEKYIVCMDFATPVSQPSKESVIRNMEAALDNWGDGVDVLSLFPNNPELIKEISAYNDQFMKLQIDFIQSGIEYASSYVNESKETIGASLSSRLGQQTSMISGNPKFKI
jgi:23S rRNA U2552 (ribose-2'-O)-methylase RlmE/FtsJ